MSYEATMQHDCDDKIDDTLQKYDLSCKLQIVEQLHETPCQEYTCAVIQSVQR